MTSGAAAKKRILFVDDESNVLDGLRVLLRKHRHTWDMEFAPGGVRALALLAERTFDVVVTDLRMPVIDGLTLLKYLRDDHPCTMRVVLSGAPERASAHAVATFAHQSLTKPCRVAELESVLARAVILGDLVADADVRSVIGGIGELPPLPRTYARLVQVLDDERSYPRDVAAIISSDLAVTAKILQLANSPFFGLGRPVTTVTDAIPLIGLEALKSLTLSSALFDAHGLSAPLRAFAEDLQDHSSLIASLATELAGEPHRRDAFSAGMLHDVGRLALASTVPNEMDDDTAAMRRSRLATLCLPSPSAAPVTLHAKVGAYLLGLWGLPPIVIDAVARHHDEVDATTPPIARAVIEAEELAAASCGEGRPSAADVKKMREVVADVVSRRGARGSTESKEAGS